MSFTTFNDIFSRITWRLPDHPFLHWLERDRTITYAEVVTMAGHVAGGLAELGVVKDR